MSLAEELLHEIAMKELAKEAIDVQSACNLSGVVISFQNALRKLREHGVCDTAKLNEHPVSVLYSSKIASLTGSESDGSFSYAYNMCKKLVEPSEPPDTEVDSVPPTGD